MNIYKLWSRGDDGRLNDGLIEVETWLLSINKCSANKLIMKKMLCYIHIVTLFEHHNRW